MENIATSHSIYHKFAELFWRQRTAKAKVEAEVEVEKEEVSALTDLCRLVFAGLVSYATIIFLICLGVELAQRMGIPLAGCFS